MVGARFRRAAQLRQHDDRDVELLGQPLERPRDRRQLQRPVLEAAAAGHQLDVVDDQQVRPCSACSRRALARISSTPMLGGVVDEQLHRAQRLERVRDAAVVLLPDGAAHQPMAVDLRLRRQQAQEQRLLRHFQAEEADRVVRLRGDVLRDVQHQAGLAHRRPRRDDDQVAAAAARASSRRDRRSRSARR